MCEHLSLASESFGVSVPCTQVLMMKGLTNQEKGGNDETLLHMISSETEEELVYAISGNEVIKLRPSLI